MQPSMISVTSWTVHYGITDSNDVTITSYNADDNGVELTGLEKGTSYTVSVAASYSAGRGQFTTRTISTLIDRKCRNMLHHHLTNTSLYIYHLKFRIAICDPTNNM